MAGLSGRRLQLVTAVVVIYGNSLSLMNGILHAVDIQGPVSWPTMGRAFTFANDVPPRRKDVLTLRRCANGCNLKTGFRETHAYDSIFKIVLELINKPSESIL